MSGANLMQLIVCKKWIVNVWTYILRNCCWISIAVRVNWERKMWYWEL